MNIRLMLLCDLGKFSISLNLRSLNYKKVFNRNVHRLTVTMPNTQYLMNDNYIFLI